MPIYEYACKECQHEFEALVYGSQKAECPKCASKKLAPKLSYSPFQRRGLRRKHLARPEAAAPAATPAVRALAR